MQKDRLFDLPLGTKTVVRQVLGKGASFEMIWRELTTQRWERRATKGKSPLRLAPFGFRISWQFVSISPIMLKISSSFAKPPKLNR